MKSEGKCNKSVSELRPVKHWQIGEQENWYKDMSAKGFHLKSNGVVFDEFIEGEPKNIRYRVVPFYNHLSKDQKQKYSDKGWTYVTGYGRYNVFSSPDELNAPEIDKDFFSINKLKKEIRNNSILLIIALTFIIIFIFRDIRESYTIIKFIERGITLRVYNYFLFLYIYYDASKYTLYLHKLKKTLEKENLIHHQVSYKKIKKRENAIKIFLVILLMVSALEPLVIRSKEYTVNLPLENIEDMPIILINEIEQDSNLKRGHYGPIINGVDQDNKLKFRWSLLAPVQYETKETAINDIRLLSNGGGVYYVTLDTKIYKLAFPFMAEHLASSLIKRYSWQEAKGYSQIKHPDLDLLYVRNPDNYNFYDIIAAKGSGLIYVNYIGEMDINVVIENIIQKLSLIEE